MREMDRAGGQDLMKKIRLSVAQLPLVAMDLWSASIAGGTPRVYDRAPDIAYVCGGCDAVLVSGIEWPDFARLYERERLLVLCGTCGALNQAAEGV
jgi:hypothetical protein